MQRRTASCDLVFIPRYPGTYSYSYAHETAAIFGSTHHDKPPDHHARHSPREEQTDEEVSPRPRPTHRLTPRFRLSAPFTLVAVQGLGQPRARVGARFISQRSAAERHRARRGESSFSPDAGLRHGAHSAPETEPFQGQVLWVLCQPQEPAVYGSEFLKRGRQS